MTGSIHSTNNLKSPYCVLQRAAQSHPTHSPPTHSGKPPAERTATILPPTPKPAESARRVHCHTLPRKREERNPTDTFPASAATEPNRILLLW